MKLVVLLALATCLALLLGPAGVSLPLVVSRLPRVIGALLAGAALALAGVAMQARLRNALAEPFVLGMSGGASLGAVAAVLAWPAFPPALAGAIGALGATALVSALAASPTGGLSATRLLLSGVAVSAVLGAGTEFLLAVAPQSRAVRAALYWTSGGLGGAAPAALLVLTGVLAMVLVALLSRRVDLDRLVLGDDTAASLGVPVPRLMQLLVLAGAGLTGAVVALAGPVGFVGLAAPHLARLQVGATHGRLVPRACAAGALLLLGADTVARCAFAPREVPTGLVTALLGGPFFLWLLRRRAYAFGEAA